MPSLWNRITSAVSGAIRGFTRAEPQDIQEPTDFGDWITGEDISDYPEPTFYTPEPEPTPQESPGWFGNEITIYNLRTGESWSMTIEEWKDELLEPSGVLMATYGMGNIDIIRELISQGEWDDSKGSLDWYLWREGYAAQNYGA